MTPHSLNVFYDEIRRKSGESMNDLRARLHAFYDTLSLRTSLLRESRREMNAYLAMDFNVFSYMDPDENHLSDLIKDLLSPEGKHGQGGVFLNLFAQQLGLELPLGDQRLRVLREVPITFPPASYGFLDLLVDGGSFGIGIENKPWAGEQRDQLDRYRVHLDHQYSGRYCLVYLAGSREMPTSLPSDVRRRLVSNGQFKVLQYRSGLSDWLRACEKECKAEKIRWLLRDFVSFVNARFDLGDPELEGDDEPGRD